MQSLVALSTMEAELIALSTALREVIHLQNLLLELRGCNFPIPFTKPQVVCHTFEDNATCIEVAQLDHKIRPRTKHISVGLFHFRDHVEKGLIQIEHVPSKYQLANIFTKPLPHDQYMRLRDQIMALHLLNTRECEVIVGSAPKCLPTSVPVLLILLRAILYCIQYLQSFPPIVRLFLLNAMFTFLINRPYDPTGNTYLPMIIRTCLKYD